MTQNAAECEVKRAMGDFPALTVHAVMAHLYQPRSYVVETARRTPSCFADRPVRVLVVDRDAGSAERTFACIAEGFPAWSFAAPAYATTPQEALRRLKLARIGADREAAEDGAGGGFDVVVVDGSMGRGRAETGAEGGAMADARAGTSDGAGAGAGWSAGSLAHVARAVLGDAALIGCTVGADTCSSSSSSNGSSRRSTSSSSGVDGGVDKPSYAPPDHAGDTAAHRESDVGEHKAAAADVAKDVLHAGGDFVWRRPLDTAVATLPLLLATRTPLLGGGVYPRRGMGGRDRGEDPGNGDVDAQLPRPRLPHGRNHGACGSSFSLGSPSSTSSSSGSRSNSPQNRSNRSHSHTQPGSGCDPRSSSSSSHAVAPHCVEETKEPPPAAVAAAAGVCVAQTSPLSLRHCDMVEAAAAAAAASAAGSKGVSTGLHEFSEMSEPVYPPPPAAAAAAAAAGAGTAGGAATRLTRPPVLGFAGGLGPSFSFGPWRGGPASPPGGCALLPLPLGGGSALAGAGAGAGAGAVWPSLSICVDDVDASLMGLVRQAAQSQSHTPTAAATHTRTRTPSPITSLK